MALVEVRHDDSLTFGYGPVHANELAIFPKGVYLVQSELILCIHECEAIPVSAFREQEKREKKGRGGKRRCDA